MDEFTPYEKLSKKQKRDRDKRQRLTWGDSGFVPVTRVKESNKRYSRNKMKSDLRRSAEEESDDV